MLKSLKGARLGIFVFLGTVMLVISIFLIGSKDFLFQETFTVKTYFPSVEGIRIGSSVRLSGINVGSVSDIKIADDPSGKVEVTMKINSEVRKFIRLDTKATIETEGLVGNKIIVLIIGTSDAPIVQDGGFIMSKPPVNFGEIVEETQEMLGYLNEITKNFAEISQNINQGKGTLGKIFNDESLYSSSVELTKTAQKSLNSITEKIYQFSVIFDELTRGLNTLVVKLDKAATGLDSLTGDLRKGKGTIAALINERGLYDTLGVAIYNLSQTILEAKRGLEKFSENMEALKHNWLFKKYFEQKGYWKDESISKEDKYIEQINFYKRKIDSLQAEATKLKKRYEESLGKNSNE